MDIKAIVAHSYIHGWEEIFKTFESIYASLEPEKQADFTDLFFLECLERLDDATPDAVLWTIINKWHTNRKLSSLGSNLPPEAELVVYKVMAGMREKLRQRLAIPRVPMADIDSSVIKSIIYFWRDIFLASYSVLNQNEQPTSPPVLAVQQVDIEGSAAYYSWLLCMSMYYPFDADRFVVDVELLLFAPIPTCCKMILVMWLIDVPRYNATQQHRQKLIEYFKQIERATRSNPAWMDPFFHLLAEWFMISLFRIAYIHDDNSQPTMLLGDFITSQMNRIFPQFKPEYAPEIKTKKTTKKIRVGYVSTRFVANAVTFYMANRIFHCDRNTFELYLFAIGSNHDAITDLLANKSDKFIALNNIMDYSGNAQAIKESELDILIFTDIGMDIATYLLAGLRLAPIQCALLGHASPTGLPNIDYFFSSEIEPVHAQTQYREKLILMPNAGSAQLIPPGLQQGLTNSISRKQLGISDDGFVFISCANGMKHVPERDYILVEILRRIPNAWILLKPFNPGDYDKHMVERFKKVGKMAGAPERIIYLPGCGSHSELFDLLKLANVQLDSYPFNGWTTNIEAFCMTLPTVTQEGNGYRSRIGAGFLRAMGIVEGIAANDEEYIKWAEQFAQNPSLCQWVKNRIKATIKPLLFENAALQIEYEKALIEIYNRYEGVYK